jgi:membrane fusion protein (multidrug efflux system)
MQASPTMPTPMIKSSRITDVLVWCAGVMIAFATSAALVRAHTLRIQSQTAVLRRANALGPRVLVMRLQAPAKSCRVPIPASIHGYIETPIYAKTAGYLKAIYVDKGDRVHKGEVLAVLESPELDKQVADAKANYWLQKVTDVRNQKLVAEEVIPQQTADNSHAALLQAKAAYEQLLALQSYEVIRAETDGIITARYVDPGALIPEMTSPGASTPIVELATLHPLRIYADVPQDIAAFVKDGDPATVTVTQYPGRKFQGTVTRHPQALAPDTRTMRVEVDLPNKDSALYPGMYATLVLNVASTGNAPRVPDDALIFRGDATYVPVVRNDRIHLARVILGNDNGNDVQIASGISAGNLVAVNAGEGVEEGDRVQPVVLTAAGLTK